MLDVTKRIALVGPICSGKSTILKITSFLLNQLENKVLHYSIISPKTFTYGELYGSTDNVQAYSSDIESRDSIYSLILSNYAEISNSSTSNIVKCIVIDSEIEEVDTECTIQPCMNLQSNREMEVPQNVNFIRFPNGITLDFPSDLYFFYESDSLRNASPRFISSVGVVITHEKFITWKEMIKRNSNL
jgi:energy-coupling factor transporter ATP-binding protein EcfA2